MLSTNKITPNMSEVRLPWLAALYLTTLHRGDGWGCRFHSLPRVSFLQLNHPARSSAGRCAKRLQDVRVGHE